MNTATLTFSIEINARPKTIFEYVSNWEKQSEWILFTKVKLLKGLPNQKDPLLLAITGVGPFKVKDTMVITDWHPYKRIVVEHTGRVVLGKGVFLIEEISDKVSKFTWQEITPIPLGFIGQIGLVLIRPIMNIAFGKSLKNLKNKIENAYYAIRSRLVQVVAG